MKRKKNFITVTKLPNTIPVPKDVPPLYIFKKNKKTNPYSELVHNFLVRQMNLYSHFSLIMAAPIREHLNAFGYVMYLTEHSTKKLITVDDRVWINKKNRTQKMNYLQNYIGMSLIAQSYENFEALIRDIYRLRLKLTIKDQAVLKLAASNIPRRNADVLKTLKTFFPSLDKYLDQNLMGWLKAIEHIRHAIVHSDQILEQKFFQENESKHFQNYFSFKKVKGKRFRLNIETRDGEELLRRFDRIGYNIFSYVSTDANYPVTLKVKPN